jgi:hypothetical protein
MSSYLHPSVYGWVFVLFVFAYTIYLIRSSRLSAHLAISWVLAEVAFMVVMYSNSIRHLIRFALGEDGTAFSLIFLGMILFILLMLEGQTRISSLTSKLKDVNQEVALLNEKVTRLNSVYPLSQCADRSMKSNPLLLPESTLSSSISGNRRTDFRPHQV